MSSLNLKVKNFGSRLVEKLRTYFENESLCDATVICKGKRFLVHQMVLSLNSDCFESIFKDSVCKHPFVILKDIHPTTFEFILKFIYQGKVTLPEDQLASFIEAAENLNISFLNEDSSSPVLRLFDEKFCIDSEGARESSPKLDTDTEIDQNFKAVSSSFDSELPSSKRQKCDESNSLLENKNVGKIKIRTDIQMKPETNTTSMSNLNKEVNIPISNLQNKPIKFYSTKIDCAKKDVEDTSTIDLSESKQNFTGPCIFKGFKFSAGPSNTTQKNKSSTSQTKNSESLLTIESKTEPKGIDADTPLGELLINSALDKIMRTNPGEIDLNAELHVVPKFPKLSGKVQDSNYFHVEKKLPQEISENNSSKSSEMLTEANAMEIDFKENEFEEIPIDSSDSTRNSEEKNFTSSPEGTSTGKLAKTKKSTKWDSGKPNISGYSLYAKEFKKSLQAKDPNMDPQTVHSLSKWNWKRVSASYRNVYEKKALAINRGCSPKQAAAMSKSLISVISPPLIVKKAAETKKTSMPSEDPPTLKEETNPDATPSSDDVRHEMMKRLHYTRATVYKTVPKPSLILNHKRREKPPNKNSPK